jgi:hypothetical protein
VSTENEKLEELTKKALEIAEEILMKACPRCGSASKNKGNPAGRCSSCLSKLKTAKKTPGHWQRAQTKADDALRRQKGKNGTAPGTSSGNGSRKEIVDKVQRAEKKTGQKLSPDRKNNSKGYSSKNVRAIPEHLNRGRHNADTKKIAEWKKRLKKSELTTEELSALVIAKLLEEYPELAEQLED